MKRRLLTLFLAATVVVLIPVTAIFVSADDTIQADNSWYTSENDLYISTKAQFYSFVKYIKGGTDFAGKVIHLKSDIDMRTENGEYIEWYDAVGGGKEFSGIIDGHGHTLSGISFVGNKNINFNGLLAGKLSPTEATHEAYGGASAGVFNLCIVDSVMNVSSKYAGALFGVIYQGEGKATIENVYVDVDIKSTADYVGGLFAYGSNAEMEINNCVFVGDIDASGKNVGGLVGYHAPSKGDGTAALKVINSAVYGNITLGAQSNFAGFVGMSGVLENNATLTVEKCIFAGTFTASEEDRENWGVICGGSANANEVNASEIYSTYASAPDATKYTLLTEAALSGINATVPKNSEFVTMPQGYPMPVGAVNFAQGIAKANAAAEFSTLFDGYQRTDFLNGWCKLRLVGGMNGACEDYEAIGFDIVMITESGKQWSNKDGEGVAPVITTVYESVSGGGNEYVASTLGYDFMYVASVNGIKENVGTLTFVVKTFHDKNGARTYDDVCVITFDTTVTE